MDFKPRADWGERNYIEAALILAIHLYKDFWTKRSLPIPGATLIADLNDHQMPKIIHDMYVNHDFNLRQLSGQGLSLGVVELIVRLESYFKYRKQPVDKALVANKRQQMLLVAHSVALAFNLGKVVCTKNPYLLNVPQTLRVLWLASRAALHSADLRHAAHMKVAMQQVRTNLEALRSVEIIDKAVVVTASSVVRYGAARTGFLQQLDQNSRDASIAARQLECAARRLRRHGRDTDGGAL